MSTNPQRVRCSPLGRREVVADVVDRLPDADTAGPKDLLVVTYAGHRYRVLERDALPLED